MAATMTDSAKAIAAMVKAQSEFEDIRKDKKGNRSKYASLDSVLSATKPALLKNGLIVAQSIERKTHDDGTVEQWLETRVYHESGCVLPMHSQHPLPMQSDPQKFGAALTYARRYSYCALLGVTADEDDDAASISGDNRSASKNAPQKKAGPTSKPGCINPAQVKALYTAMTNQGYTERMQALFKEHYGVTSAKDLPSVKYQEAINIANADDWKAHFQNLEKREAEAA